MAEFKLTIGDPKIGKSYKKEISGAEADALLNVDVGEEVSGDNIGFPGYKFEVTGGSDHAGFPMRRGIKGAGRQKIFTYEGVGFSGRDRWKNTQNGLRVKKTVRGQKIGTKTTQINLKILDYGPVSFEKSEPVEGAKDSAETAEALAQETPK